MERLPAAAGRGNWSAQRSSRDAESSERQQQGQQQQHQQPITIRARLDYGPRRLEFSRNGQSDETDLHPTSGNDAAGRAPTAIATPSRGGGGLSSGLAASNAYGPPTGSSSSNSNSSTALVPRPVSALAAGVDAAGGATAGAGASAAAGGGGDLEHLQREITKLRQEKRIRELRAAQQRQRADAERREREAEAEEGEKRAQQQHMAALQRKVRHSLCAAFRIH